MPVLNPADLWQRSGRYSASMRCSSSRTAKAPRWCSRMTAEEVITFHVSSIVRSYRQLPFSAYHFQTKERDEPRPRAGILRTREFIMKDAYTFDRDRAGLDEHYEHFRGAYDRIFDRVGLEWYRVESDVGMMGGFGAHEYMAPCPAGENDVALAPGYAANVEVASAEPAPVELPEPRDAPEEVPTPGLTTIAEVAGALHLPEGALLKSYPVMVEDRGLVLVVLRGDHQVNDIKLANALGATFRAAREDEFAQRIGPAGSMGPVGADVPVLLDDAVAPGPYVSRRQPRRLPPAGRRARPRLPVQARRRPQGRAGRHGRRPPDPHRAGDRGRQHLQARHALLRAAGRHLPRRVRQRAADLDGLLRHRPGAHLRRRGRAVRRRAGHLVAALDLAVRRPPRRPRQARHRRARAGRAALRRVARRRARRASTTTARTSGRAASSPTPSCSAARCA